MADKKMKDRYRKIQKKKDRKKGCERIMSKEKERNLEPDECKHFLLQRPLSSFPFLFHFAALGGDEEVYLVGEITKHRQLHPLTSPPPHHICQTCCFAIMKNVKVERELSIIQLQQLKFGVVCSSDGGPAVSGKIFKDFFCPRASRLFGFMCSFYRTYFSCLQIWSDCHHQDYQHAR